MYPRREEPYLNVTDVVVKLELAGPENVYISLHGSPPISFTRRIATLALEISSAKANKIGTTDELESRVAALEKAFEAVFKVSCPANYNKKTLSLR